LRFEKDAAAGAQLDKTVRLDSVRQEDFDSVFYPGGHGPMWDLAEDAHSIRLIESFIAAGKPIGKWMPHVMVYYPFLSDSDLGLVDTPDNKVPGTVDPGTAFSALVVVTPGFVDPGPTP